MTQKNTPTTYGRIAQALHWISTLLILTLLFMGLYMTHQAEGALQAKLYQSHTTIGFILSFLTLLRVIWILFDARPAIPVGMSKGRQFIFRGVHVVLYLFLFLLAFSGIAMLLLSGVTLPPIGLTPDAINHELVPVAVHDIGSKFYILFFLAHIGGVISYQLTKSDVLSRMGIPWFTKKNN